VRRANVLSVKCDYDETKGPTGAHKATNRGEAPARILMFSSTRTPAVAVYPDSDKIGVWPGNPDDEVMLRRADGDVGYWDGERRG